MATVWVFGIVGSIAGDILGGLSRKSEIRTLERAADFNHPSRKFITWRD